MALREGIKRLKIPHQYPRKTDSRSPLPRRHRRSLQRSVASNGARGVGPDLVVMPYLNCGTAVNTMGVVAKARMLKERLSEFFKEHDYDV